MEILQSMYPGSSELELSDPAVIHDLQEFINTRQHLPSTVELTLRLNIDQEQLLEAIFSLPREYPTSAQPQIYIRS